MPLHGEYQPGIIDSDREQVETYIASRATEANTWGGRPIIVLTTAGAKSGSLRKTTPMRVEHDGHYAIVASHAGSARPPSWYWNVRSNPRIELQDGNETADYVARELSRDERAVWWARAVAAWPAYSKYERKMTRLIQVILLERILL